jgi:hypothetical protein
VVAREAVPPLVAHAIPRPQHEDAALLHGIAASRALPEALREGPETFQDASGMEGLAPAIGEARRAEGVERGVGVERARVARDVAEALQVLGLSRPDDDKRGAAPGYRGLASG